MRTRPRFAAGDARTRIAVDLTRPRLRRRTAQLTLLAVLAVPLTLPSGAARADELVAFTVGFEHNAKGTTPCTGADGRPGIVHLVRTFSLGTGTGTFATPGHDFAGGLAFSEASFCVASDNIGTLISPWTFATPSSSVGAASDGSVACLSGSVTSGRLVWIEATAARALAFSLQMSWTVRRSLSLTACVPGSTVIASGSSPVSGTAAGTSNVTWNGGYDRLTGALSRAPSRAPSHAPSQPSLIAPADASTHPVGEPEHFRVRATDADGEPYRARITIRRPNGSVAAAFDTAFAPSGNDAAGSAPVLQPGSYTWSAVARDVRGVFGPASVARSFTVVAP